MGKGKRRDCGVSGGSRPHVQGEGGSRVRRRDVQPCQRGTAIQNQPRQCVGAHQPEVHPAVQLPRRADRKSTRLNSSHANISYAVFCLKKKKKKYKKIRYIITHKLVHTV